jgi:radical SAM superfamily enzyme YgiQ (UPF0313 family)
MSAASCIDAVAEHRSGRCSTAPAGQRSGRRANAGDILLTHAYYASLTRTEKRRIQPYAPLGILYLAAFLRQRGRRVRVFDTTFAPGIGDFINHIERRPPALVAISVLETTRPNARGMMDACERRGIPVVAGGPDPSSDPAWYARRGIPAVIGEGEETMAALLDAGDVPDRAVAGVYISDGTFVPRPPAANPDLLPFPARDLIDYAPYFAAGKKYHGGTCLQLAASRGGPACGIGENDPGAPAPCRMRAARAVAEEMQFVKMIYGPDRLWFVDQDFGADAAWVGEFRQAVAALRARVPFECSLRAETVTDDLLRQLKDAGCFRIWYGAASGSPRVLERMRAGFGVADLTRACARTRAAGIEAAYSLVLGHPAETVADVDLTRQLVRTTRPDRCRVTVAYPQKGTRFFREVERELLPVRYADRREDDRILTFRNRYSQNFYDMACRVIEQEALAGAPAGASLSRRLKCGAYRIGYRIIKNGLT